MDAPGSLRPQVGITWGSNVTPAALRKLSTYAACVRSAGGEPLAFVPPGRAAEASASAKAENLTELPVCDSIGPLGQLGGLLFSGGPDVDPLYYCQNRNTPTLEIDPGRDELELALARRAIAEGMPVLGICRGLQLLNVALGGTLHQDVPEQVKSALEHRQGAQHRVVLADASRLALLAGRIPDFGPGLELSVNSYHHQAIERPSGLAERLVAVGWSDDGLIEAIEAKSGRLGGYFLAVQWHPERQEAGSSRQFVALAKAYFEDFVAACTARLTGSGVLYL